MNILMIGGSNVLMNHMIEKYRKEGHRIFILTGSRYKNAWYERSFERYDFPYDAINIPEVFESVDPDVIIYLGAYDSNYTWKFDRYECGKYVSGVINLLMAFSSVKKGRFIYLSSEDVFLASDKEGYKEDDETNASSFRGMAIKQGEDLCKSYAFSRGLDIVTVRFGGLYYLPLNLDEINSRVSQMILEDMRNHQINIRRNNNLSFIFDADAIQFLISLIYKDKPEYDTYHISSKTIISERQLAEMIADSIVKNGGEETRVLEVEGLPDGVVLDSERFTAEFSTNRFARIEDGIDLISRYMLGHADVFLYDKQEKKSLIERIREKGNWLFKAVLPFVENMILFIPFFMLNNRAVGSQYFSKIDFYLLYVLLFSIVYGQQQATFSAILATAGYIFRQMYNRSGFEVLLDYNTYIWIAQLFIVGLSVGYLKDQIKKDREEAAEDHSFMSVQLEDIKEINESNVHIKNVLETQVVSQEESVGKVYSITSTLDQYSSDEVLFKAVAILQELLGTKDIAIYTVANDDYARLFTAASEKAMSLGNSIKYREMEEVYEQISQKRVYINKKLDDRYPLMANAIYDREKMKLIVFAWGIPWERMTLSEANLLAVASSLIQNAVLQANRYMNAISNDRYVENTKVLKHSEFEKMVTAYTNAENERLTEFTLLRFDLDGDTLADKSETVAKKLRLSDYLGEIDNELYALLTNTDDAGGEFVIKRFKDNGIKCEKVRVSNYD
ncbi:MAG: NAD(P)-dependent oxidoreductase [Erysipelotrichaceae bacterium]|nr:NAD(P)-dependent oxidoreductase [Erysipelotrichaceae bacterium]